MPNFYNETYMKEGLHNGKMNSLARSNASLYGTKDDLYDRLKRHAYPGKKGTSFAPWLFEWKQVLMSPAD